MQIEQLAVLAGLLSTSIFAVSHIPMLIRAIRTKDLRSYSATNLVLANVGNMFHWLYVVSLPWGPIWLLHSFYTITTALMLLWYIQYRSRWPVSEPCSRRFQAMGWSINGGEHSRNSTSHSSQLD